VKSAFLTRCLALLSLLPLSASAYQAAPDELIRKISHDVLQILATDPLLPTGETSQVAGLVEQAALPHFNFRRMTNALTCYRDQAVGISPLRVPPSDETAKVHTNIRQPDGPPVPVDHLLGHGSDGWKIFDVVIAGAHLLANSRGTLTQQMNMGGFAGLIKSLEAKGRENAHNPGRS
jgi:phospholipid transport system substrate-binding protein